MRFKWVSLAAFLDHLKLYLNSQSSLFWANFDDRSVLQSWTKTEDRLDGGLGRREEMALLFRAPQMALLADSEIFQNAGYPDN